MHAYGQQKVVWSRDSRGILDDDFFRAISKMDVNWAEVLKWQNSLIVIH